MATYSERRELGILVGWEVNLDHDEPERIAAGADIVALLVAPSSVTDAIAAIASGLATICATGGHRGVKIIHTFIGNVTVPLPKGGGSSGGSSGGSGGGSGAGNPQCRGNGCTRI